MTKAQNRSLEREKLQDIKIVRQRLNHSTRLDTKNDYKKREPLIICLGIQKHASRRSILSQSSIFFVLAS